MPRSSALLQRLHRYIMPKGSPVEVAMVNKRRRRAQGQEDYVPTFPLANLDVKLHSRAFAKLFFDKS